MPSHPPTVGAGHDLIQKVQELEVELTAARHREAAIADILRVINRSPTDVQPALDAVARSAARLCDAEAGSIFRRDDNKLRIVAHDGPMRHGVVGEFSLPLTRGTANGRSVLETRTVHIADLPSEVSEYPEGSETAQDWGHRAVLAVPLIREGIAIGSISVHRAGAQLFTEAQVALLETFADQAVIVIENARLFEEVQTRTRELTESLQQQTATADVLKVISRSAFDLQTILDTLVKSAARLCAADMVAIIRAKGNNYQQIVGYGFPPGFGEYMQTVQSGPVEER